MKADGDKRASGRFQRSWNRSYRINKERQHTYICVCTEGEVTEKSYLDCIESVFEKERKKRSIKKKMQLCLVYATMDKKTTPQYFVKKIERKLESLVEEKDGYDSAWIICDYDSRKLEQMKEIEEWCAINERKRCGILTNENIEKDWFNLHFQKNSDYQAFMKGYNKRILNSDFTYKQIVDACERARARKQNLDDLYTQRGSLMYKIVEYIGYGYGLRYKDSRGCMQWLKSDSD